MSAADAPSSPSALDHEKDFGSKFATFHTVGDFFGESDVTNDNSVYPFTAIAGEVFNTTTTKPREEH